MVKLFSHSGIKSIKTQSGYILLSLMILTALIPTFVLIGLNYTDVIMKGSRISKTTLTKTRMLVIRNIVASKAKDVDSDGYYEVLKEGAGNTVPLSISVNSKDEWGTDFRYCTYDLQTCNQVDATYSQYNPNAPCTGALPPVANLVLRIVSAGKDKIFQTSCSSATSSGDDIVFDETEAGIRSGGSGGSGWVDDGTVVRLADPNDKVGIGTLSPRTNLDVRGSQIIGGGGLMFADFAGNVYPDNWVGTAVDEVVGKRWLYIGGITDVGGDNFRRIALSGDDIYMSGYVGIGALSPSYMLHVEGTTYSSGGYVTSDKRWKKDIIPLSSSEILEKVLKLQGVNFYWNDEKIKQGYDKDNQTGLIAQEVEKVFPEIVSTDNKGYKAIAYDRLSIYLLESVKELKKEIDGKKTISTTATENTISLWVAIAVLFTMNIALAFIVIRIRRPYVKKN